MKAIVAVEHAILIAIWNMANTGAEYDDPGPDYDTRRDPDEPGSALWTDSNNSATTSPSTRSPNQPKSGCNNGESSRQKDEYGLVTQAILQTHRITLVPLSDEHLELEVELDSDPEVMRYLTGRARTRAEVEAAHERRLETAEPIAGLGFWIGLVAGHFVGWWLLQPPERPDQGPVRGQAELGYRLLRRFWRQGLASEGSRELLRHGFDDLDLNRVFAETMAANAGSRATMAAVGLRYVRTFHHDLDPNLPYFDLGEVEYAVTRADWRAARP